jgi:zinc protease
VLCIAGNFSRLKAISLLKKYFETIPRGNPVPLFSEEKHRPPEETVKTLENFTTPTPAFYLGYRIAPPNSSDFFVLTLIEHILLRGRSSRLYSRLLLKDRTARQLSGGIEQRKGLATFKIFCRANTNTMMERSQKALFSEIGRIKSDLVPEEELQKAKNMFKIEYLNQYARLVDRAIFLAERMLSKGTIDDINLQLDKYMSITPASVIGIANRYFAKDFILLNIKTK